LIAFMIAPDDKKLPHHWRSLNPGQVDRFKQPA
jgi:hypothetical protein